MANTTNFGWETPDDTDLVKDGALAMRTLGNAIDTSLVDLKGGTTGQILAKNTNTDMDFVWINNDQGDITAVTAGVGITGGGTSGAVTITNAMADAITTKGDLLAGTSADNFARLGVGANGTILTANSATATGLEWAAAAAGGGMTLLSTTTLSGSSTTISVSPSGYVDLEIQFESLNAGANNIRVEFDAFTTYRYLEAENRNGTRQQSTANAGTLLLNGQQENAGSGTTNSGRIRLYDINSTLAKTGDIVSYFDRNNDPTLATYYFAFNSTAAIANVYFKTNGSFSGGTVKIYGVK